MATTVCAARSSRSTTARASTDRLYRAFVYHSKVADQRNPSGRRPPALPLPPPPEDLPRLPEVNVDDSAEVRIDHRALAPNRDTLSGARARSIKQDATRLGRPTAPDKPRRPGIPPTLSPPPRSAGVRVHTAQHSSLIGGRYQI